MVGAVTQARLELAGNLFKDHYHAVLWYGDSSVLGTSHREQLRQQYNTVPIECGYVVRLAEYDHWNKRLFEQQEVVAGTVSIPWLGENSMDFLMILAGVLKKIPQSYGCWRLFVDMDGNVDICRKISKHFNEIENCRLESPGGRYASALRQSKIAVIFGGYNSLMDVLHAKIPAVVVVREMQDEEQQIHLQKLQGVTGEAMVTISESQVSAEQLEHLLLTRLHNKRSHTVSINTSGAARAAEYIYSLLGRSPY